MKHLLVKLTTLLQLGLCNILRVVLYRLSVRIGINPVRRLSATAPAEPFFAGGRRRVGEALVARRGWYVHSQAFGLDLLPLGRAMPDWLSNCLTGQKLAVANREWWQIPDFDTAVGDIKTVWEASRFDWVLACVQNHLLGDADALPRLEAWLLDWLQHNPPYKGPNWKCGQEASIRVMHLAMAACLMDEVVQCQPAMLALVKLHLQRIAPTIQYALAQDNNHGTSEAAALLIGGSWLAAGGDRQGKRWMRQGRKWLENRAARLIETDGSFSQYSLNYHRVMLDTFSMAEVWRQRLGLPTFSQRLYQRLAAANDWLRHMIQAETGDAPNLGANDGARLLPLTDTDYRDYRPSVQLASVLFCQALAYEGDGSWNQSLKWLELPLPSRLLPDVESRQFNKGGYMVLRNGKAMAMLRYPRFRFRPSQADVLHLDLWVAGQNWLRDAGTYSYNTAAKWLDYFPGTVAHNTVQFDGRDQMPRLSRFLFGRWLKTQLLAPVVSSSAGQSCKAGYKDAQCCTHTRSLELAAGKLTVTDGIGGLQQRAVLRWRLAPGDWTLDMDAGVAWCDGFRIQVTANVPLARISLVEGWESRYYLQKTPLSVLEVEVNQAAVLTSIFEWQSS